MTHVLLLVTVFTLWTPSSFSKVFDDEAVREMFSFDAAEFILSSKKDRFYQGVGGTHNYYAAIENPSGSIETPLIVVTGAEDPVPAWFRLAHHASTLGYRRIYIIEIRGQGQSQRVPGNTKRALHVRSFENYYRDFVSAIKELYWRCIRQPRSRWVLDCDSIKISFYRVVIPSG